jgi:dihydropteroate synthase
MPAPSTKLVGILNITPDSFSDGRETQQHQSILTDTEALITQGAYMIDVGAESTRPGATALSHVQEWQRLAPVLSDIITLCHKRGVKVSVDSYHPETIQKATTLGIDMINDVSGGDNPAMLEVIKHCSLPVVIMHHLGIPVDKSITLPEGCDPIVELIEWANKKIIALQAAGVTKDRIILDPGIGFGKTAIQSLAILQRINELSTLELPLYVGHSRKSFLSLINDVPPQERDIETLTASLYLAQHHVAFLRVHNIALHSRAFAVASAFNA